MNQIKRVLCFLIWCVAANSAVAETTINLEVKVFGRDVIFVFYHENHKILYRGNFTDTVSLN